MWAARVEQPFRDDPQFWASVGRSADAFWALLVATVLVLVFGPYAAVAFVVPVGLLVLSGRDARAATGRTRPMFADRLEWRGAERRAVSAALPGAFVRHLRTRGAALVVTSQPR